MLTGKILKISIYVSLITIVILSLTIHSYTQTSDPNKETNTDQQESAAQENANDAASSKKPDNRSRNAPDETKRAERIEATLKFGIQKDRIAAINSVNNIKDEQIKKRLIQVLESIAANESDMNVKKAAITVIGDNKSESSAHALIKALDDSSEDIKIAACYAIGKIKADSARPKLVELFNKQNLKVDSNYTEALISTLTDLKAPDILDAAVTAVKSRETTKIIKERLLIYIGQTGSAAQKDVLLELYKDDDEDVSIRSFAIRAISRLKLKDVSDDIKATIKEIDSYSFSKKKRFHDLHMYSVAALVELGDTDSIPLLMDSLRSDNATTRLRAVNLIKDFNDERTIDILKYKMENDPNQRVRDAAKKALEDKGIVEKDKSDRSIKSYIEREESDD